MMEAVIVNDLTRRFGDFTAVDSISFTVHAGEIFGFLGPNGAGKSTTIKMLCGILAPSEGRGSISGLDIVAEQDRIKNAIGYMSQRFSLYEDLTGIENLEFFGGIYGLDDRRLRERIDFVCAMAGIGGRAKQLVKTLPGGIKQRLALGAAIIHDPPVLFLDEPTSGVDPVMRRNFWDIIYRFSEQGKTIFVTTHYLDEAEHCDRIALIIAGKIIALDSPAGLKRNLPYDVYAVRVDNFIEAFGVIDAAPFVEEAAIFGSDIHVLCKRRFNLKKEIGHLLDSAGYARFTIEKIMPTLEDVFVTNARKFDI